MIKALKVTCVAAGLLVLQSQLALANTAPAKRKPIVDVNVDISAQVMNIEVNGELYATWKVSTAKEGYYTPRGTFYAKGLEKLHISKKYDNAPMPNSVFFHYGYAIHATNAVKRLGTPASHGCVRLSPANAAEFFALVENLGLKNTRIRLVD